MVAERLRRSALYIPGSNERALEKGRGLAVDCVILDLEDAVSPSMKAHARGLTAERVRGDAFAGREVIVRINNPQSPEGIADLEAMLAASPDGILVPKIEEVGVIERLCAAMDEAEARRGMALWAMIETPKALLALPQIAAMGAKRRLAALVVGANDLCDALGMHPGVDRAELMPALTQVLVAARSHGLAALDAVYNDHKDLDGFRREAKQARAIGFDGKTLIHPDQIPLAHDAFRPSEKEIAFANRVIAAYQDPENLERGAITVDGKMVERMHLDAARRTLAMASETVAADDG